MTLVQTKTKQIDVRSRVVDFKTRDVTDNGVTHHVISGYAVVFEQNSLPMPFVEVISKGAFDDVDLSDVKLLYSHDFANILARTDASTLALKLDKTGLYFEATLPDTTLGRDVFTDIQNGNLKGCSFGFTIADDDWNIKNGAEVHTVNKIGEMPEISITAEPAYIQTSVQVERSLARQSVKEVNDEEENKLNNNQNETPASAAASQESGTNDVQALTAKVDKLTAAVGILQKGNTDTAASEAKTGKETNNSNTPTTPQTRDEDDAGDSGAGSDDDSADSALEEDSKNQDLEKRGKNNVSKLLTPKPADVHKRDFLKVLQTRDASSVTGVGLSDGALLIPSDILPVTHETYQFPRLSSLVRTVSVHHSTGKLPTMYDTGESLKEHTEYTPTTGASPLKVVPINWDLKSYTGAYVYSQELIMDSDYDWQSELAQSLNVLRDNTDDSLIIKAVTDGVTAVKTTDLVSAIKTALNVTLKPVDSAAASIILSQSAYNALDQMKDGEGRPLVQPDLTKGAGSIILGKTFTVVDDTLFPSAKSGDTNVVIAPLQKAVVNFKSGEVTGKFQDTYDVWYSQLGIFLREDVVQARQDLIINITADTATVAANKPA